LLNIAPVEFVPNTGALEENGTRIVDLDPFAEFADQQTAGLSSRRGSNGVLKCAQHLLVHAKHHSLALDSSIGPAFRRRRSKTKKAPGHCAAPSRLESEPDAKLHLERRALLRRGRRVVFAIGTQLQES
jgi:hypothetical protein